MTKKTYNKFIDTIDECVTNGVANGIYQVKSEDDAFNGRTIRINGNEKVNFGSCSYLGLEVDDRLKQGAIEATMRFGTQYSSSRAFSACKLYEELESLLSEIFNGLPIIVAATTTLSHVSAFPILLQDDDLLVLDHQVHGSVQLASQIVKARGTKVEMIRHNRMDMLEDMIKKNPNKYHRIWYMADGLYSMYGDYAPIKDICYLLDKYHNFHFYVDDAHGMSWTGHHGQGYVLGQMSMHPKMVLTTSLAKGFGTGGGVTVLPDPELRRKILTCGSSYTFSGPVQPPMLGASIASAKIHLSDEIYALQQKLKSKISLANRLIKDYGLPLVVPSDSPIFYLGLGLPRVGYNMAKRLMNEGFYTNIGIFPAAPINCTGLRLPINNGQTDEDIQGLLQAFQYHFPQVLEEEHVTLDKLSQSFKIPFENTKSHFLKTGNTKIEFEIQHETSILNIDPRVWDDLLGDRGAFDWEGCRFIEESFSGNPEPENNWKMHYLIIRDIHQTPVLATFFTEVICKDDMIAPATVSQKIEEIRQKDKYYLTSKVVMMGSLITMGDHLYINRGHSGWKQAFKEMLRVMNEVKLACEANSIQLRDFVEVDAELRDFLIKDGFIKLDMPDAHTITGMAWCDEPGFMKQLSSGNRWHFRRKVQDKTPFFDVRVLNGDKKGTGSTICEWYQLYSNVKRKSFNINTFELPLKFFELMAVHPQWEVLELRLSSNDSEIKETLASVAFCYRSAKQNYSMTLVGLDYDYVVQHGSYRQALYQSIVRGNQLNCNKIFLGMDASIEKQRFGAATSRVSAYLMADDSFNMELIGNVYNDK